MKERLNPIILEMLKRDKEGQKIVCKAVKSKIRKKFGDVKELDRLHLQLQSEHINIQSHLHKTNKVLSKTLFTALASFSVPDNSSTAVTSSI